MEPQNLIEKINDSLAHPMAQVTDFVDENGVRTFRDAVSGKVVKTLTICNGGVSEEQIKAWKAEHRKVHLIEVEDDGELFIGYFRRPDMETMSAVNKVAKTDEVKSSSVMFDNCWLGGDPVLKTDIVVRMAAIRQLSEIFNRVHGELKNL